MPTTPPSMTPPPVAGPPSRNDPTNFRARMDAFLAWIFTWYTELGAVVANVYANAVDALGSAVAASSSAAAAGVQAQAAAASAQMSATSAGASLWVSGTNYAAGAAVLSPITTYVYRRRLAGAGTTDPSADPTNWTLASSARLAVVLVAGTTVTTAAGGQYITTNAAATTLALPDVAEVGDTVGFIVGNLRTDNVIARNGHLIMGRAENMTIGGQYSEFALCYGGVSLGWRMVGIASVGASVQQGVGALTKAQSAAVTLSLSDATGGSRGFVGAVTKDSFGVHWVNWPINFGVAVGAGGRRSTLGTDYAGTESADWVRTFFPFSALFNSGASTFTTGVLADFLYALKTIKARGQKWLLCPDDEPTSSAAMDVALYRDRLTALLTSLESGSDYIDAIEPVNEALGVPATKLAEIMRVTHTLCRAFSPKTVVCTPSFQGGENAEVGLMLAASAAGVSCRGSTGTGTRGEMFFDVIAYHPYGVATSLALARQNLTQAYTERTIREYSGFVETVMAARRADVAGGGAAWWAGKPDPEFWATELNVSWNGANITSNADFRFQALTPAEAARMLQALMLGCFASGYSKLFVYSPSHAAVQGPWTAGTRSAGTNGDLRVTGPSAPVFDGDVVMVTDYTTPRQGIAYECAADGLAFTIAGVPSSYVPAEYRLHRFLLGGFHPQWRAAQAAITGQAEFGFFATGASPDSHVPQVRLNRGEIQRVVAGRLQVVAP